MIPDDVVYAALLNVRSAMRMRWGSDKLPRANPDEARREQAAVFVRVPKPAYLALERRGLLEFVPGLGRAAPDPVGSRRDRGAGVARRWTGARVSQAPDLLTANLSEDQLVAWDRDVDAADVQRFGVYNHEPWRVWLHYHTEHPSTEVSYEWLSEELRWLRIEAVLCICDAGRRWERDIFNTPYPQHMGYCGCAEPVTRKRELDEWEAQRPGRL